MDVLRGLPRAIPKDKVPRLGAILLFAAIAAGCDGAKPNAAPSSTPTTAETPAPTIDRTTPDKALRSYWAMRDYTAAQLHGVAREYMRKSAEIYSGLNVVAGVDLVRGLTGKIEPPESFTRDILEVKVESDSRAVIDTIVRNSTPVPPGAEPTAYGERARRFGERFRYVLDKEAEGWRVVEIWDWDDILTKNWNKRYPKEDRPYYPALAFGGL